MANPRRAITVVPSIDAIESEIAPLVEKYYLPLDYPAVYRFAEGDASTPDGVTTLESAGGPAGTWQMLAIDDVGEDLAGESVTVQVGDGLCRYIPAGTLTGNITLTLGTTNARPGYPIEIVRLDVGNYTVTIIDGFSGGGTLCTMPALSRSRFVGKVNGVGTHWLHRSSHLML